MEGPIVASDRVVSHGGGVELFICQLLCQWEACEHWTSFLGVSRCERRTYTASGFGWNVIKLVLPEKALGNFN